MVVAVVADSDATGDAGGMRRSKSWTGTVDIGYALGETAPPRRTWPAYAAPAACAACAAAARASWASAFSGLALLLAVGPTYLSSTYTVWNCVSLLGQVADAVARPSRPPRLLPFLVVNSWAIFASFNVMAVAHPPHFAELAKRLGTSLPVFHVWNALAHFAPAAIATSWFLWGTAPAACDWTAAAPPFVAPLLFHLAWALRVAGGLTLDRVYLKRPKFQWYVAWATAAATHVAVGAAVARRCAASS